MNEEAPTNSVGTGAETALPPAHEPPGVTALSRKKPKKRRRYTFSQADMLRRESTHDASHLPFLISYDGAEQYVLYSKSEAALKIELRKIYRPENFKKLAVKRLYPNEVIQFYYKKRQAALRGE